MGSVTPFKHRFAKLRESEDVKDKLIEDLLAEVEQISTTLADTILTLRRENDLVRLYQQRHIETEKELKSKINEMDRNAFISVLIDGDGMNFQDEIIKSAEDGGKAAQLLKTAVTEHVRTQLPDLHDVEVVIRVYANVKGLAKTYINNTILEQTAQFDSFMRSFNMALPLCDYVDAGSGKECADEKLRALFKLHLADVHCKYIVFGGSGDNGYARLLGQYSSDDIARGRITLLEGPPFEKELANLADKFTTISFPSVFRNTKLQTQRVSFGQAGTLMSAPSPKVQTYASLAKNAMSGSLTSPPPTTGLPIRPPRSSSNVLLRNSNGQRIDSTLERPPKDVVTRMKARSRPLCIHYHLADYCEHHETCVYSHEEINEVDLDALQWFARQKPCHMESDCRDIDCPYGHECQNLPCKWLRENTCKFPRKLHGVSKVGMKDVSYEAGV